MEKKDLNKLIAAVGALVASLFLLIPTSLAWFSMNKQVDSAGMQMSMDTTANLIIADTEAHVRAEDAGYTSAQANYTITYNSGKSLMLPSTLDWVVGTATGLKYVKNTFDVGFTTGLQKDGKTLIFDGVPAETTSPYYVDFDAYIASSGKEMTGVKLVASLSTEAEVDDDSHLNAATVVFYNGTVSSGNKIGEEIAVKDMSTKNVEIILPENKVPLNTAGYIHIIVRCYFDGALVKTAGTTYITSQTVNTDQVALHVTFEAVDVSGS